MFGNDMFKVILCFNFAFLELVPVYIFLFIMTYFKTNNFDLRNKN